MFGPSFPLRPEFLSFSLSFACSGLYTCSNRSFNRGNWLAGARGAAKRSIQARGALPMQSAAAPARHHCDSFLPARACRAFATHHLSCCGNSEAKRYGWEDTRACQGLLVSLGPLFFIPLPLPPSPLSSFFLAFSCVGKLDLIQIQSSSVPALLACSCPFCVG